MFGTTSKRQIFTRVNEDIILIHQDSMSTSSNFNSCNCYLVKINENDYVVIDPGCSRSTGCNHWRRNHSSESGQKALVILPARATAKARVTTVAYED